jgi:hypothetical protein
MKSVGWIGSIHAGPEIYLPEVISLSFEADFRAESD